MNRNTRPTENCLRVADEAEASYYRDQFDIRTNTMKQLWQNLNAIYSNKRGKTQTIISCLKLETSMSLALTMYAML